MYKNDGYFNYINIIEKIKNILELDVCLNELFLFVLKL
jgi:hypothetical protein